MSGDSISGELVDYLNNELPAARRAEIEELLRRDPARARELEEYRSAQQAVKGLRVAGVSADFGRGVRERIALKVGELRARGSTRFRTGRERVEAAREGLSTEELARRGKKAVKFYLLALLIAAPVLTAGGLTGIWYFSEQARLRQISERARDQRRRGTARAARGAARGAALKLEAPSDGRLRGLSFLGDDEVRLVMHAAPAASERCVFVYAPAQWAAYLAEIEKLRGLRGHDAQLAAAESALTVKAAGGALYLPPAIYQEFLGAPARVEVLRLKDRAEIWTPEDIEEYFAVQVRIRPPAPAPPGE